MMTISILSTLGLRGVLGEAGPAFERESGERLAPVYDSTNAILRRVADGERADVAILTAPAIDDLVARRILANGSRTDLARSGVGVAVRAGHPKPDISSVEAFKRALLAARSIAHSKTGASGVYFSGLVDRLGIGDAVRAKAVVLDGLVGEKAANGEAEIAVQQISELMPVAGIEIVGPLPEEIQTITVFSAGLFAEAAGMAAAKAFLSFLTGPGARSVMIRRGLEPV